MGLFTAKVEFPKLMILRVKSFVQLQNPHILSPLLSSVNHIPRQSGVAIIHWTPASTQLRHNASTHTKDEGYISTWLGGSKNFPLITPAVQIDKTTMIVLSSSRIIMLPFLWQWIYVYQGSKKISLCTFTQKGLQDLKIEMIGQAAGEYWS